MIPPRSLAAALLLAASFCVPAAAALKTASFGDNLAALGAQPGLELSPEIGGVARTIGADPSSPLSASLAQALGEQLPQDFNARLAAALAAGDRAALSELAAALEAGKDAAQPGIENVAAGYLSAIKEDVKRGDFTRKRLRRAAAALAPLAIWGPLAEKASREMSEISNAATLQAARRWAQGLEVGRAVEEEKAVETPVSARDAHALVNEYASAGSEANVYSIGSALQTELEWTDLKTGEDARNRVLYDRKTNLPVATLGITGNDDGVTVTWAGAMASRRDGSSAPVFNGRVLDLALALAQRGWDVNQIGPLRYRIAKRSIEPRLAVVKALRSGLRLAGPVNEAVTPRKTPLHKRQDQNTSSPIYSVDPEQPALVRLNLQ